MKTTTAVQRLAEREFLNDATGFAPVDRRGLPLNATQLERAAKDTSDPLAPDPRFAGLAAEGAVSARDLKKFLADPDAEAVHQGGDAQLIDNYEREHAESIVHLAGHQARVRKVGNEWIAKLDLNGTTQTFRAASREKLMDKLVTMCRALTADNRAIATRPLAENERLECVRLAQQGFVEESIERYVHYSLNKRYVDPYVILHNPEYRDLCDEACTLAWVNSRDSFSPTPERQEFISQFCAGRPLTISLLDAAWRACQEMERGATSQTEQTSQPTTDETSSLDDLSDDEITSLHHATMRHHALRR